MNPKCLVNGRHTVEHAAQECPALGRSKRERLANWQRPTTPVKKEKTA